MTPEERRRKRGRRMSTADVNHVNHSSVTAEHAAVARRALVALIVLLAVVWSVTVVMAELGTDVRPEPPAAYFTVLDQTP